MKGGHYGPNPGFFAASGGSTPPLRALSNTEGGGNGVFAYNAASVFPTQTFQSENDWVDLVFVASIAPDTTPPTVTAVSPANGATSVGIDSNVTATFSEAMDAATIGSSTFQLRDPSSLIVPAVVTYDPAARTATLHPSSWLSLSTTYTATVLGGATDPRAKDVAGNALALDYSWSFTTSATPPPADRCPCSIWSTAPPPDRQGTAPTALELAIPFPP